MQRVWRAFRKFLTAEEVPRWFGLSVVLIYVVGLATIAQFGIAQARRETAVRFQQDTRYAVKLLAERVGLLRSANPDDGQWTGACQLALREFLANVPAKTVRIVDGRRVLVSTSPTEAGVVLAEGAPGVVQPDGTEIAVASLAAGGPGHRLVRAPVAGQASASFQLEAVIPLEPVVESSWANRARMLAIILAVLGALFVVYRCLREQLRGVSRIADRLEQHRDRIEQHLSALRISDAMDEVTTAWNELVDLTERLLQTVQRTEANDELSRVLQRSSGGALSEALNALPDGILYVANEGRFEYANTAACRLFGWSPQDVKRFTLADAGGSSAVGCKALEVIRAATLPEGGFEAKSEVIESEEASKAGPAPSHARDVSTYRIFTLPLQRPRQQGECLVLIRDVSQQLRAERAREEFIAQVTHELRTPLTNIRAYTETLSSGMFEDPKVITECYNVITKETRRLSRLVEDILSVSQLEVGTISLQMNNVDLKALLGDSVRDVRGLAEEKSIDIQLVLPSKLEPIRADRDKLAVVINNLLGNAIKYTPAQGNVVVGCQLTADAVVITVKDNGIGIDPSEHSKVFEKFQRGSNPEVQHQAGTGIGLYTAREIVRRHGGDIELISERNKGSTFMVRLPHRESRATALSTIPEGAAARG